MEKIIKCCLIVITLFANVMMYAQRVGIGTNSPHSSAILDVSSTTKGFLAPRLTAAQRNAITSPANGLLVYETGTNGFYYYNGTSWTALSSVGGSDWKLTGNSGTNPAAHFFGTTDNASLQFKINNNRVGWLDTGGSIYFGYEAGKSNSGVNNVVIGNKALFQSTTHSHLIAIGDSALYWNGWGANEGGDKNIAIGSKAMYWNRLGKENTAVGYESLYGNHSGDYNVAVGRTALRSNFTGTYNTAVGAGALGQNTEGNSNTAIGYGTLFNNIGGTGNVAVGASALLESHSGRSNIAIGLLSAREIKYGFSNIAIGTRALSSIEGQYRNIAIGDSALLGSNSLFETEGSLNIAIGVKAGYYGGNGSRNVFVGVFSGYNSENSDNVAIGYRSMHNGTTGFSNTVIGAWANVTAGNVSNATAIGYGASVNANNKAVIGNTAVNSIGGYANWSNFSDGRFKQNVHENVPGIAFISRLRPVSYTLDIAGIDAFNNPNQTEESRTPSQSNEAKSKIVYTGFIAQEVEQAALSIGYDFSGVDKPENTDTQTYALRYSEFVVPLAKAVQEQQQQIELLKQQIADLQSKLESK